jgi:hypothetical protein
LDINYDQRTFGHDRPANRLHFKSDPGPLEPVTATRPAKPAPLAIDTAAIHLHTAQKCRRIWATRVAKSPSHPTRSNRVSGTEPDACRLTPYAKASLPVIDNLLAGLLLTFSEFESFKTCPTEWL